MIAKASNKIRAVLAALLAVLMIASALSLVGCEPSGTPDESGASDGTSGGEQTEAPVILGDFKITEEVRIIYSDRADTTIKNAGKMIAQAIFDKYGITVKVSSDWNPAQGPEILVGNCGYRDSAIAFTERFYANGYGYAVLSETEIAISAKNNDNVYRAVKLFIDEVIKKTPEYRPCGWGWNR